MRLLNGFINVTAPIQITMDQCAKQVQNTTKILNNYPDFVVDLTQALGLQV